MFSLKNENIKPLKYIMKLKNMFKVKGKLIIEIPIK